MPRQSPPPKGRTAKQRLHDSVRVEGRGMQFRPKDEGPYDRVMGKDMLPEESIPKVKRRRLAKGGRVKK